MKEEEAELYKYKICISCSTIVLQYRLFHFFPRQFHSTTPQVQIHILFILFHVSLRLLYLSSWTVFCMLPGSTLCFALCLNCAVIRSARPGHALVCVLTIVLLCLSSLAFTSLCFLPFAGHQRFHVSNSHVGTKPMKSLFRTNSRMATEPKVFPLVSPSVGYMLCFCCSRRRWQLFVVFVCVRVCDRVSPLSVS